MFKKQRRSLTFITIIAVPLSLLLCGKAMAVLDPSEPDYNLKLLGKYVFFDKISEPKRMACVTCHLPETGGTGGVSGVNLHQVVITGANPHTAGNLKPPTNAYASFIPTFHPCADGGIPRNTFPNGVRQYCGGNFWSGRAEGYFHSGDLAAIPAAFYDCPESLPLGFTCVGPVSPTGSTKHIGAEVFQGLSPAPTQYAAYFGPTSDQALNPMPNVVEQNIQRKDVCLQVQAAQYAPLYKKAWGTEINCSDDAVTESAPDVSAQEKQYDISFKRVMLAVGAWQSSKDLNSFSSKRDVALKNDGDGKFPLDGLTCQENYGHDLFYAARNTQIPADRNGDCQPDVDKDNNPVLASAANCAFCHSNLGPVSPAQGNDGTLPDELYTHQDYHNIQVPFNPEIPVIYPQNTADSFLQPPPDHGMSSHLLAVDGFNVPDGFFKTPTLRNVDKRKGNGFTKAYMHNGYFKSLERVVHFYNTAAIGRTTANNFNITRCPSADANGNPVHYTDKQAEAANCWPDQEFPGSPSGVPFLVGDLKLTLEDEAAIVAYLKTLTDLDTPVAPQPYKDDTASNGGKKK